MKKQFLIFGIVIVGVVIAIGIVIYCYPRNMGIEFVHAEGEDIGKQMPFLPVFTPQDGIGQGEPIYDCPGVDLAFALSLPNGLGLRSVSMMYLGVQYALTETAQGSLAFADGEVCLTLSKSHPSFPQREVVSGAFFTLVTVPEFGITNAFYVCAETADDSSFFENGLFGVVLSIGNTPSDIPRTAMLEMGNECYSKYEELTEIIAGAGVFTNLDFSVSLLQISGKSHLAVTDRPLFSNAVFSVWETAPQSNVFRNYNEAIPTDLSPEDLAMTDFTPWRLKITDITDPTLISKVILFTTVDRVEQVTFSNVNGALLSDQKFILVPDGKLEAPPPEGYTPLRSDVETPRWQNPKVDKVSVLVYRRPFWRPNPRP